MEHVMTPESAQAALKLAQTEPMDRSKEEKQILRLLLDLDDESVAFVGGMCVEILAARYRGGLVSSRGKDGE